MIVYCAAPVLSRSRPKLLCGRGFGFLRIPRVTRVVKIFRGVAWCFALSAAGPARGGGLRREEHGGRNREVREADRGECIRLEQPLG